MPDGSSKEHKMEATKKVVISSLLDKAEKPSNKNGVKIKPHQTVATTAGEGSDEHVQILHKAAEQSQNSLIPAEKKKAYELISSVLLMIKKCLIMVSLVT